MVKPLKHISRIRDEFDTVICSVQGVLSDGVKVYQESVDTLVKMYQSGKKIALASNSGVRAAELFVFLKQHNVPMNIFYAIITAGEIAHFYLKHNPQLGTTYYPLAENVNGAMSELPFQAVDSMVMADFVLVEMTNEGVNAEICRAKLEQALDLGLPLLCVGNNTSVVTECGVRACAGALAEQYAMMGGKIISFGKPDLRIAAYLTEELKDFDSRRCLVIGDNMATDIRMGNNFQSKNLLITDGIYQVTGSMEERVDELSTSYGLNVDYCMERLQW